MGAGKPQNEGELFAFYKAHVKPLYSAVQASDNLPLETLHEITAAFDHLSRIHTDNVDVQGEMDRVYSHLKRSCLDIYKIKLKETNEQYRSLHRFGRALTIIDNGAYVTGMERLYQSIRERAKSARLEESLQRNDPYACEPHFGIWQGVYNDCCAFEKDFFEHPGVAWAKLKMLSYNALGIILPVIAAMALEYFFGIVAKLAAIFV